jgi:transcriptional regulator with PAS, ATPase and Fis domain
VERRLGKFEAADSGTLFLDEIGDLSLTAQAKLLRVLQEKVVEHVGGRKPIPVDVRILSATNKNLEAEIQKGTFRQDLYYRLKVIHVQMPPLREVREDVPGLANYFLTNYCREMKTEPVALTPEAAKACMEYDWPGNARELENEMKRLVLSVSGNTVAKKDLSEAIRRSSGAEAVAASSTPRLLKDVVSEIEKRMIREALQQTKQNQLHAAKTLGLSRHGLIKKMKRYNIRFRDS